MIWRRPGDPIRAARLVTCTSAALILASLFAVSPVLASRNLGGHMYWKPRTDISPNTVEFHIFYLERLNSPGLDPAPVNVGDIYEDDSKTKTFTFGFTGPGSTLNSGDIRFIVREINHNENWVLGEILSPGSNTNTNILVNYPNATARIAQTSNACCLPPYDQLNAGRSWRLFSRVIPGGALGDPTAGSAQSSLLETGPVHLNIGPGSTCFTIPVDQPAPNITRKFRKSDRVSGETGSTFYREPPGILLGVNDGLVCWDTSTRPDGSAWSFAVQVEDFDAGSGGFLTSSTVYMEIVTCASANAISYVSPSPPCQSTIDANPGVPLTFTVQASDAAAVPGGLATMSATTLPAGSSVSPAPSATLVTNPALAFSWTPTVGDIGSHTAAFSTRDVCGDVQTCSYTIKVNAPPNCGSVTASIPNPQFNDNTFQLVTLTGATDPDGDPITYEVTGVFQDEALGALCPDAQIIGVDGYVRRERDNAGAGGNGRVYTVHFIARDDKGGSCTGSATVCVPRGNMCVNGGELYDSQTECGPGLRGGQSLEQQLPSRLDIRSIGSNGSGTTLEYSLPTTSDVSLSVYDIAGRHLSTLVNEQRAAGVHTVQWSHGALSKGIYFYRLRAGETTISKSLYVQ
jgi:hypothetical protein